MSRSTRLARWASKSFPRVSGDEPALAELLHHEVEFSPRERG